MAQTKENVLTKHYSGIVDQVVFQADGVIRSRPDVSNRKWSKKQKQHLTLFDSAKGWGRKACSDPELSALYRPALEKVRRKNKYLGIYQLAIMDFLNPPEIKSIAIEKRSATAGTVIRVNVFDKVLITEVQVCLVSSKGKTLEAGDSEPVYPNLLYSYSVADPSRLSPGTIIRVRVGDLPGNVTQKDFNTRGGVVQA